MSEYVDVCPANDWCTGTVCVPIKKLGTRLLVIAVANMCNSVSTFYRSIKTYFVCVYYVSFNNDDLLYNAAVRQAEILDIGLYI